MTKEMELMIQNQMITNNLLTVLVTKSLSGGFSGSNVKLANLLDECVDDAVIAGLAFKDLTNTTNKE